MIIGVVSRGWFRWSPDHPKSTKARAHICKRKKTLAQRKKAALFIYHDVHVTNFTFYRTLLYLWQFIIIM